MDKNERGFSLVVVVIFMSIAALFIGYLMGSWLISFLIEDDSAEMAEQKQNKTNVNQQLAEDKEKPADQINNKENNLTAPTEEERKISPDQQQSSAKPKTDLDQKQSNQAAENSSSSKKTEITGGFGVQIGAFSNYNNALSVKDKVEDLGYEVVITDSTPHQVKVIGYESREAAESAAAELDAEGYKGFIVIIE